MLPVDDDTHPCFFLLFLCSTDSICRMTSVGLWGKKKALSSVSLPFFRKHTHTHTPCQQNVSVGVFPHELSVSIVSERLWATIHIRTRVGARCSPPPFFSFLSHPELLSWSDSTANSWAACLEKGEGVCV